MNTIVLPASPARTFYCDFGDGTTCTVRVDPTRLQPGAASPLVVEWTGKPTGKTVRRYKAWMLTVNQTLADEFNVRTMHAFLLPGGRIEAWIFSPGKQPTRTKS